MFLMNQSTNLRKNKITKSRKTFFNEFHKKRTIENQPNCLIFE